MRQWCPRINIWARQATGPSVCSSTTLLAEAVDVLLLLADRPIRAQAAPTLSVLLLYAGRQWREGQPPSLSARNRTSEARHRAHFSFAIDNHTTQRKSPCAASTTQDNSSDGLLSSLSTEAACRASAKGGPGQSQLTVIHSPRCPVTNTVNEGRKSAAGRWRTGTLMPSICHRRTFLASISDTHIERRAPPSKDASPARAIVACTCQHA